MRSGDIQFDMIEGDVDPAPPRRAADDEAMQQEPPAAPELPAEQLARSLRRLQRRRARLRCD